MKYYELYDSRTKEPMTDKDSDALAYGFNQEPQNDDLIEVNGKEYTIQRVWLDGKLILRLCQTGVVFC